MDIEYMKRYPTAQITGEMHIGIRTTSHLLSCWSSRRQGASEDVQWRKPCSLWWWDCREYIGSATMETGWRHLRKLKKELLFDPAIIPLCKCLKERKQDVEKIPALPCLLQYYLESTRQKQTLCLLVNEWIKKIHNGMSFSHEKKGISAICVNRGRSWGHYAKWDNSDNVKYCILSHVEPRKDWTRRNRVEWWFSGNKNGDNWKEAGQKVRTGS